MLVAVCVDGCGMRIVTIPSGVVVEVAGEVQLSGLVDVRLDGCIASMYLQDLQEHAECLQPEGTIIAPPSASPPISSDLHH